MRFGPKVAIAVVALALAGFVGYREISSACGPAKVDEHGHGHGHGEEGGAEHAAEGFTTKVCEDGFFVALRESILPAGNSAPSKDAEKEKGHKHGAGADDGHGHEKEGESSEGLVKLSAAQIKAAGITMRPAASGELSKEIATPGRIALDADTQARIVPKLTGTVASIEKQIGDPVRAGDLLATIESREMADAKADYLAAVRSEELARSTFDREERLWKQKVTAEQDYLAARNAHAESKIKLDVAHQRLHAIGLDDNEIDGLPKIGDESSFRTYQLRSPIRGQITARNLVLGQTVGPDKEVFVIADPAKVWVEMAVAPGDLASAKQGQDVRIRSGARRATAKIIALSPVIDPETRSAKAIAELENASGNWKPGDYVEARLVLSGQDVDVLVPLEAIQTVKGQKVVFVNEASGFRMRPVTTGREDTLNVEIVSGLEFGETIATSNTFALKAELGKAEAEHEH